MGCLHYGIRARVFDHGRPCHSEDDVGMLARYAWRGVGRRFVDDDDLVSESQSRNSGSHNRFPIVSHNHGADFLSRGLTAWARSGLR